MKKGEKKNNGRKRTAKIKKDQHFEKRKIANICEYC